MRAIAVLLAVLLIAPVAFSQAKDPLAAGFVSPPASAKPHTWWHWLNGNSSKAGITADLEAMKRAGIGGVQIFSVDCGLPSGPVPFGSPEWREHTKHAITEAGRLGIEVCIHNCAGWSSSGGPWVTPENAMQMIVWTETVANGPGPFDAPLRQPETRNGYYRDIALFAVPVPEDPTLAAYRIPNTGPKAAFDRPGNRDPEIDAEPAGAAVAPDAIINLAGRMSASGHLQWTVPEGRWVILRMGHTCTGAQNAPAPDSGRGLEVDKLSRSAMDAFWDGMMAKVIADVGPLAGKVLNNSLIDSYETGYQNWTARFPEEFAKRRGYDLLPWLPIITGRVIESKARSERFLWDFRRTVADMWADNYYAYFAELCHKNGLQMSTEPYGNGGFDNLQCGGLADIPMGEFWVPGMGAGETLKIAASAAHTNGRTLVGAESFTADENQGRWKVEPFGIKALGDRVFCEGINRYIFHRYAHQPWTDLYPGLTMGPWGTHLERTVTWWNEASAWFKYIARCQHLLQSGKFAADLCYFTGEAGPNDLPGRGGLQLPPPAGYDYDGCDTTVVMNRMSVSNGRIVLPDSMSYRVLVLPNSRFMTPAMARRIRELVSQGAVVVGPKPDMSPSLNRFPLCDGEVQKIGAEVWGDCDGKTITEHAFGKGKVYWGAPLADILKKLGAPPDFEYRAPGTSAKVISIHRTVGATEVYFVSNQAYRPVTAECLFRVTGKTPELWHADTGTMEMAPVWREEQGRTVVPIRFDPAGSVFVVFRKKPAGDHLVAVVRQGADTAAAKPRRIEVTQAWYEAADGVRGAEVTAKVSQLVAEGQVEIPATNDLFGDPVPLVVKQLRVRYTLNGAPMQAIAPENGVVMLGDPTSVVSAPDWEVAIDPRGQAVLTPWKAGTYTVESTKRRTAKLGVNVGADTVTAAGAWHVAFDPAWGGPADATLEKLMSWSERPESGIRYYSGSAVYTKDITVTPAMAAPGRKAVLDLGVVKNFAEVKLNGKDLGILWKSPFAVDVTGLLKPGRNTLEVRVTNLWPNRLIGDDQKEQVVKWSGARGPIAEWPDWFWGNGKRPADGPLTFTTWRFYDKESPLLESGLLGPVVIRSAKQIVLK